MIRIENLNKSFGDLHVLKNISLEVQKGEIFGLIGKSGEGKSTLLRCVNMLEQRDSGTISLNGKAVSLRNAKDVRQYRKGIGMIFQHFPCWNVRMYIKILQLQWNAGDTVKRK